ncbi:hypothetical protein OAE20_06945 [Porticoccaceae bacterium]|nr:hypothetical protein [Porticoccaceae bacterium]
MPWVSLAALLVLATGLVWGLAFAPEDARQGNSFRIIYIHVPAAFLAQSGYFIMAIAGAIGLIWKMKISYMVMKAAAPIGAALTFIALDQAYGADSQNQTVLGLKGIQAFQEADYPRAISYWQGAARGLNPAGDSWKALQSGIQQARQLAGEMPFEVPVEVSSDTGGVAVTINLSIAPSIQFTPDQSVFVAIIEADGPPMPLAARKLVASQLPLELVLDHRDELMAGRGLADKNIRVVARLSSTGSATPQLGDWQVISDAVESNSADLQFALEITSPYVQ